MKDVAKKKVIKLGKAGAPIASCAFSNRKDLTDVELEEGVTGIGWEAFARCPNLKSLKIPSSVVEIDECAFDGCFSLKSIDYAGPACRFEGGAMLSADGKILICWLPAFGGKVVVPESVKTIGKAAFPGGGINYNISNSERDDITDVYLPKGLRDIREGAFAKCTSLKSVAIPEGVTKIGKNAFRGCISLTSVAIPASVTKIGEGAFSRCSSLKSIAIPEGVTAIACGVFADCTSLKTVSIPDSVTELDENAFSGCSRLTEVEYSGPACRFEGGAMLSFDGTKLRRWMTFSKTAEIPAGVTAIGPFAFEECTSLKSVSIPEGVTEIGESAFCGCNSLGAVSIPEGVKKIGDRAFNDCNALKSVSIPEGVPAIGKEAFRDCTSLKSVAIPGSVTKIGESAFRGCTSLESVAIPEGVTEIGENAFVGCDSLALATVPDDKEWSRKWRRVFPSSTRIEITGKVVPKKASKAGKAGEKAVSAKNAQPKKKPAAKEAPSVKQPKPGNKKQQEEDMKGAILYKPFSVKYDYEMLREAYDIETDVDCGGGDDLEEREDAFSEKYGELWGRVIRKFEEEMGGLCGEPEDTFEKVEKVGPKDGIYVEDREGWLYTVVLNGDFLVEYSR